MAHRCTEKEVHLLSGPPELQPVNDCVTQYTPREKAQDLLQLPDVGHPQPPDASEAQHRSNNQDKNTADSQKLKKLSFKPNLLIMMIETLSGTILLRNFHLTLSTRQNQILPLLLILYFQKEGRKLTFLQLQKTYLHLHLQTHWRQSRDNLTLQDQESQRRRTLEGQPVHIVTFICRHYFDLD